MTAEIIARQMRAIANLYYATAATPHVTLVFDSEIVQWRASAVSLYGTIPLKVAPSLYCRADTPEAALSGLARELIAFVKKCAFPCGDNRDSIAACLREIEDSGLCR
jgi:hypothetical protein